MGWGEWSLTVFTVAAQTAIGAFWWCCIALLAGGLPPDQAAQLERLMAVIWAMVMFAFCAAAFHLGSPLRAINASFRFGRSHFSNEVVFGSVFVGLGGLGWLMNLFGIGSGAGQMVVLGLTVLASFAFLASMTAFYLMPTVPTWHTPLTPAAYLVTTFVGGSALAAVMFGAAGASGPGWLDLGPAVLASVSLFGAVAVTLAQGARLPRVNSSIRRAVDLSPHFAGLMAIRFAILFAASGLWGVELSRTGALSPEIGAVCVILVMVGEMIGRGVHYGLHMTVGLR